METVSIAEARRTLSDLVTSVGFGGKRVILARHGKPVAVVISWDDLRKLEACEQPENNARKAAGLAALEEARAVSAMILAERHGEYLPSAADVIREAREERTDELFNRS